MISLKKLLFEQTNSNVELIQQKLRDLGYEIGTTGPNGDGVDGILGKRTLAALDQYKNEKMNYATPERVESTDPDVLKSLTGRDIDLSSQLAQTGTGTSDFETFKTKLAAALGINLTDEKSRFFDAWAGVENTKATNNPFATTLNYKKDPDMTKFNLANRGQGVKNFSTLEYGVDATAITMKLPYYSSLIQKLQQDNITSMELAKDSSLDKWGTGSAKIQGKLGSGGTTTTDLDNIEKTNEKSELERLKEINTDIFKHLGRLYNVVTLNPDKYFSQFNSIFGDSEDKAEEWFVNKFYNPMTRNYSRYVKELKQMSNSGKKYVLYNIEHMNGIAQYIRELLRDGKQGSVNKEYSTFYYLDNENDWMQQMIEFKWNYM